MNVCVKCNKNLKGEIIAMQGMLFCSERCAVKYLVNDILTEEVKKLVDNNYEVTESMLDSIIASAKETAKGIYSDTAEVIVAEDIE